MARGADQVREHITDDDSECWCHPKRICISCHEPIRCGCGSAPYNQIELVMHFDPEGETTTMGRAN